MGLNGFIQKYNRIETCLIEVHHETGHTLRLSPTAFLRGPPSWTPWTSSQALLSLEPFVPLLETAGNVAWLRIQHSPTVDSQVVLR